MRASLPVFAKVHKPLISFLGKRTWSTPPTPSYHPAAPPEYRKAFSSILQEAPSTTKTVDKSFFSDFWDAPARLWRPKHHELQGPEIDAIQSGGASLR